MFGVSTAGDVNLSGDITSDVTLVSTDAGSSYGPELSIQKYSSPAAADYIGQMFQGESSSGANCPYAKITGKIGDLQMA